MRVRYAKGPDFAGAAEALRIRTSQIFAASAHNDVLVVVFTAREDGMPPFSRAELVSDDDGILVVRGTPVELDTPMELRHLLGSDE